MPTTPSPSSSAFHFPSPVPKKEQPNAHPYAIRTSSTGILSRSNSTSSNASLGPHHYVPPSPSSATKNVAVKRHRPSRHRYSRSLTGDAPQPLPPPPGVSPSPTQELFVDEPEGDEDLARKRGQRAETLPSSIGAPMQNLDLPDDPKTWTASQLSTYLASTLRAGTANLPGPVAKDIASFVKDKRITGRVFLRLSEDDLIQYGVNQLWRTTILNASRSLRQTILRGRIWGFGNTPTSPQDEDDAGNLSSSSSNAGRRSRHSSIASTSSDRSRVQDLIDSLERTSSAHSGMDEEGTASEYPNGRRSLSPTKLNRHSNEFATNYHSQLSPVPPKPPGGRPLPSRGAFNSLFSPTQVESDLAAEEKEDDPVIKQVAKKNIHGREPRMLPFPPTNPGTMSPPQQPYPYPLTPDHSGNGNFHSGELYASPPSTVPNDQELGFRPRIYSPHSQAYVVRHNPASPSNSAGNGGKRLLPFPPVTGEAALHHPKPRRLVGTNTGVDDIQEHPREGTGYESSESGSRLGTIKVTASMSTSEDNTEDYESALEAQQSQSESDLASTRGTVYQPAEDEEPSMEELLASQGDLSSSATLSNSITGVEAWEMELGDTVKRISGGQESLSPSSKLNARRGSNESVAEIGRKAGRTKNGTIGTMGSRKVGADGLKRGGILDLFSLQPPAEQDSEIVERPSELEVVVGEGTELSEKNLDELSERERLLASREEAVAHREEAVAKREEALDARHSSWLDRQASEEEQMLGQLKGVQDQASELEQRERHLRAKEEAVAQLEEKLTRKEGEVRRREEELERDKKAVEEKVKETDRMRDRFASNPVWPLPLDLLKKCWGTFVLPIVGEERTPTFLSATTNETSVASNGIVESTNGHQPASPNGSTPYRASTWSIKRDVFLGRAPGGGYLVLMSIGVCVVALRILGRRASGIVGGGGRQ